MLESRIDRNATKVMMVSVLEFELLSSQRLFPQETDNSGVRIRLRLRTLEWLNDWL